MTTPPQLSVKTLLATAKVVPYGPATRLSLPDSEM